MSGDHEVNQIFFDDVRVPVSNRVGAENDGWRIAKYLLEFERGAGHQVPALLASLAELRQLAEQQLTVDGHSLWSAADFRMRFSELEIVALATRLTEERLVYAAAQRSSAAETTPSLMKLSWSELALQIDELMIEAACPYATVDQHAAFATRDGAKIFGPASASRAMRKYLNDRYPLDGWENLLDLNLKAPFFLVKGLLPVLRRGVLPGWPAAVINIGSISGLAVQPRGNYAYAASKAGLHQLTRALAKHLAPEGILVNAIAPGLFLTGLSVGREAIVEPFIKATPAQRAGGATDIAHLACYLASRSASFICGAVIPLDGGASL